MHKTIEEILFTPVFKNKLTWVQKYVPQTLQSIYKYILFPPKLDWALEIEKRSADRKDCFIPLSLSEAETKEFVHKCFEKNVTVTSAIAAAIAKSVQEIRDAQDGFKFRINKKKQVSLF